MLPAFDRHNQTYKAHKNGIKRPKKNAYASRKGVSQAECL